MESIISSLSELGSRKKSNKSEVSNKLVHCPNRFSYINDINDENGNGDHSGCKEMIKINKLELHLASCKFNIKDNVYNILQEEEESVQEKELKEVQKETQIDNPGITLHVTCEHCKRSDIKELDLSKHYSVCQKMKIKCTKCNILVERGKLKLHIDNYCTEIIIPCKYIGGGCKDTFKRSELSNHLSTINHMEFMIKLIDKQSLELKELSNENKKYSKLINEQSLKIKKLTDENKQFTDQTHIKYKSKWVIENFTNIFTEISSSSTRHYSPSFIVGNNSFRLNIRSDGGDPIKLSLFLSLDKFKELPLVSTKFTLVNIDKKKNYSLSFDHRFEKAINFGYQRTLQSQSITNKNGWLSDKGALVIEFSVCLLQELK